MISQGFEEFGSMHSHPIQPESLKLITKIKPKFDTHFTSPNKTKHWNLTLFFSSLSTADKDTAFITIPSLGRNSVYHEMGNLAPSSLTESALSRYEPTDRRLPVGPFIQVEKLNAQNRLPVLSHLIRCYTKEVGLFSENSHKSLCNLAIKLTCTGYKTFLSHRLLPHTSSPTDNNLISKPRINVSSELLCEILHAIYFVMFNSQPEMGLEALECLHQRANYELYSNVLLLTNAIKNSLEHNPSGQPYDGPMGVSITVTPATILSSLNKQQAITNASFKTEKLPDDITPEIGDDAPSDTEGDSKTGLSSEKQSRIMGKLAPLKSALKRVEKSITPKRHTEAKEGNTSPAKVSIKIDGHHHKATRQNSGRKVGAGAHEMTNLAEKPEPPMEIDSFHSVGPKPVDIVISPPGKHDSRQVTEFTQL